MRSARLSGSLASRERVVRKSSRTSSSIERPCRAARRRSRSLRSSSSRRIVILAITSLCAINDCIKHNAREPSSQDLVSNSLSSALYSPKRRAVQVTVALHDVAITCHQPARGIGTLPRRGASITDASGRHPNLRGQRLIAGMLVVRPCRRGVLRPGETPLTRGLAAVQQEYWIKAGSVAL